jgi:hypothetical protein
MKRVIALQQLVSDGIYTVDERTIADAILMRARYRVAVPDAAFRNDLRAVEVKSFRLDHEARSFRLTGVRRRQLQH